MSQTDNTKQKTQKLIDQLAEYLYDMTNALTDDDRSALALQINSFAEANKNSDGMSGEEREKLDCGINRAIVRVRRTGVKEKEQAEKERRERERVEREREFLASRERDRSRRSKLDRELLDIERQKKMLEEMEEQERLEREARARKEAEQLEQRLGEITSMDLPLDWSNIYDTDERAMTLHAERISDGLILSLNELGRVDIEFIASVTDRTYKEVIEGLKGSIFQDPDIWKECFYKGWLTAEDYLSGNLHRKLVAATEANKKYRGYFADNIEAIKKVLPPAVSADDIYVTLGSPWVPTDIIDDFIEYLFGPVIGTYSQYSKEVLKVKHDERTGTWTVPEKGRYSAYVRSTKTWGVEGLGALYILEDTLNMSQVKVTKQAYSPTAKNGIKRVVDRDATIAAIEKQRKMTEAFRNWVWQSTDRTRRLTEIYEARYGCVRRRIFDGSFLEFPGMSPDVTLYPYQKNAAARIIFSLNTLLAHDVGAGKTYEMIAAGQEMRRMGLSEKNMYVVPNNIVGQWRDIFLHMYPDADLLCIEPKDFKPDKRASVLRKIRDESFDGIIIAYSCFEMIPVSREYLTREIDGKIRELENAREDYRRRVNGLSRKIEKLSKEKEELWQQLESGLVCFDEMGVTRLFVDEAHNFKNVPIDTKTGHINGISRSGSKKCKDMMTKVHVVQRSNEGGGVIFATGTPITNSITDAYIMQKYLQEGELALLDLDSFDGWIGMFAEKTTEFEIDIDTSSYRLATRFTKFHNLPELTSLLASIADFHSVDGSEDLPSTDGRVDVVVEKSAELAKYLGEISDRAEKVRAGKVSRHADNLLKITTDGRKAALDIRLVTPDALFSPRCKAAQCAEKTAEIYFEYDSLRLTQLIFCDTSTPKSGFNMYTELKTLLVKKGVREEDIAFVHDADSEAKREKLFKRIRQGEIRILIGSTFKLGLGVNVQDRLIALHHIDVPWRPADMTQREGRILRRGNMNDKVFIYRYVTAGSFDAYSWQLLETKQRFISDLLSGSIAERSGSDVQDTALDYAEVKALAVGDPRLKERVIAANQLSRYLLLRKSSVDTRLMLEKELLGIPATRAQFDENLRASLADHGSYQKWKKSHPPASDNAGKIAETEARKVIRERLAAALEDNEYAHEETVLMTYRGFRIVLPANMRSDHPYVWLCGEGRHYVELGDKDKGNLVRIDNYLERLGEHCESLREGIRKLERRKEEIEHELERCEDYGDKIEYYTREVERLDELLGAKKK